MMEFLIHALVFLAVPLAVILVLAMWAILFVFVALEVSNIINPKEDENE